MEHLKTRPHDFVAFDIETTGVEEHLCQVIGVAFAAAVDVSYYIPTRSFEDGELKLILPNEVEVMHRLCEVLGNKKLIMHNGVFDVTVMKHFYNLDLTRALYCDTILLKHTVEEDRPFGLKDLAVRYFGEGEDDEQKELGDNVKSKGGKWTKQQKDIYMGDMEIIAKYACKDVNLTIRLFDYLSDKLEKEGLEDFFYSKEVMPLYRRATIPMKLHGVFVDVDYFKDLKSEIESAIIKLTDQVFEEIEERIRPKVREILDKYVPVRTKGQFAEKVLRHYNLPVPLNKKTGKPTLAMSALQSLEAEYPGHIAVDFLTGKSELPDAVVFQIKKEMYVDKFPENPHVFNLSSNPHLSWLLFESFGVEPKSHSRKTGNPQVNKDSLHWYKNDLPFVEKLLELKKEEKLLNTYVKPILERQHNGWLYPSMQQFGTTSGRYSCGGGLNLQTLPRDDARVKKGFIAPPGYKVVNADFSALEPRIFSWVSGDEGLKKVWLRGEDLYSRISIDVFELDGVSADPSAPNYLKKVNPQARQDAKVFTLAVPYGANEWRIGGIMGKEADEARDIINKYLDKFPGLRNYMQDQEETAKRSGMVYTAFGRIRHLPEAKGLYHKYGEAVTSKFTMKKALGEGGNEVYYKFRNLMNNAKNFPIQATAAHVTNSALIMLSELFNINGIDGWIALQVHDEITCIVKENQAEQAAQLLKQAMEENPVAKKIDIPMIAEPLVADNFAEAK